MNLLQKPVRSQPILTAGLLAVLSFSALLACAPETEAPAPQPEVSESTEATAEPVSMALADEMGESFYFHGKFQEQFSDALFVVEEDYSGPQKLDR
jgi:nitrous oxide reductase accessory protein NosL